MEESAFTLIDTSEAAREDQQAAATMQEEEEKKSDSDDILKIEREHLNEALAQGHDQNMAIALYYAQEQEN